MELNYMKDTRLHKPMNAHDGAKSTKCSWGKTETSTWIRWKTWRTTERVNTGGDKGHSLTTGGFLLYQLLYDIYKTSSLLNRALAASFSLWKLDICLTQIDVCPPTQWTPPNRQAACVCGFDSWAAALTTPPDGRHERIASTGVLFFVKIGNTLKYFVWKCP